MIITTIPAPTMATMISGPLSTGGILVLDVGVVLVSADVVDVVVVVEVVVVEPITVTVKEVSNGVP